MSRVKGSPKTGGKKKGSKHKKTIEQEKALGFLREAIREHLPELIQNKLELARGIWCEQLVSIKDKKGKTKSFTARVYRKEPDSKAIDDLFDRVVGKPRQLFELEAQLPTTVIINILNTEIEKAKKRIEAKKK
jgi:hypothetical protein